MDDVARLRQEVDRAQRAADVLNNALVKEAFEALEKQLIEGLIQTSADEDRKREKIHMMLLMGRKWQGLFKNMMETGKLASLQLDEKRKLRLWG